MADKTDKNTIELDIDTVYNQLDLAYEASSWYMVSIAMAKLSGMNTRTEPTLKSSEGLVEKVQELKRYVELNTDNVSWVILHGRINCILSILSTPTPETASEGEWSVDVEESLEHIEDVRGVINSYDNEKFEHKVYTRFVLSALSNIEKRLRPPTQDNEGER